MSPTKPVGEKLPDSNGRDGNTGAHVVSPAPNQDVRGPGGPTGDDEAPAAGTAVLQQQDLKKPYDQRQQLLLMPRC